MAKRQIEYLAVNNIEAFEQGDGQERTFNGVAATFGTLIHAHVPTVLMPGSFTKTLQEKGNTFPLLWQHKREEPIGVTKITQTPVGVENQGIISDTACGRDRYQLIKDFQKHGLRFKQSIGFDPIPGKVEYQLAKDLGLSDIDPETSVRVIREVRLWEISLVTFPANPLADVREVNSMPVDDELYGRMLGLFGEDVSAEELALILKPSEEHAGRVLSGKNRKMIEGAMNALKALLDAAEPQTQEKEPEKNALTVDGAMGMLALAEAELAQLEL